MRKFQGKFIKKIIFGLAVCLAVLFSVSFAVKPQENSGIQETFANQIVSDLAGQTTSLDYRFTKASMAFSKAGASPSNLLLSLSIPMLTALPLFEIFLSASPSAVIRFTCL